MWWTVSVEVFETFLSLWIGGFAGAPAAAWTAWVVGVVVVVLAATAMSQRDRRLMAPAAGGA